MSQFPSAVITLRLSVSFEGQTALVREPGKNIFSYLVIGINTGSPFWACKLPCIFVPEKIELAIVANLVVFEPYILVR
jgi:hypothetical protein